MVEGDNHVNVAEITDRQGITGEQATRANEGPAARTGLSSVQPASQGAHQASQLPGQEPSEDSKDQ